MPSRVAADRYGDSPGNGFWFLYDLGGEYAGLIETEVDLPPGTVVDISHGEHIADGRVRNRIGDRNFTDRYIAGADAAAGRCAAASVRVTCS